jgi:hypothetical protein
MSRLFALMLCIVVTQVWAGPAPAAQAEESGAVPVGFSTPQEPPRVRYKIDFAIRFAEQATLQGRETIRFTNSTRKPMQTLAVAWWRPGGRQTLSITAAGYPIALAAETPFPQDFVLAKPLPPGESLELEVEFDVSMPFPTEMLEEPALSDWHPQLWWGVPGHCDYEVRLTVPKEYAVITSGRFDSERGCYCLENAPSFGIFLGRNRSVLKRDAGGVAISCLYKPENQKCAELLIDTAVDVVNFYRERFGFYPYPALSIVPGMDRPAGGNPFATGIIVIHGMGRMAERSELHWRWITAHEIGHQYWSRHVMEKEDPGWLWIGLGIYMDREYCRAKNLGTEKHRELIARYIEGVRQGLDTTVNRSQEEQQAIKFDYNNVVTHGKGFAIISTLDCLLGNDTFQRLHRRCLSEFAGRRMGLSEFQAVCEQESGQDLGWFFDQWVNSNKYLAYEIASQNCQKGEICSTEVQVRCLGTLKMPIPVMAYFEDGTSQQAFTNRLHGDMDTVRFQSRAPLKRVRLDPEGALPMVVPPPPSP